MLEAAEGTGDALALITWVAFGAAVVGPAIAKVTVPVLLYAVLSLTVVRMLPVFLCLLGTDSRSDTKLFIGWFGPRGLASIVFIVIVAGKHLPGQDTMAQTVAWTIIPSVLAHGLTANPLANAFAARLQGRGGDTRAVELSAGTPRRAEDRARIPDPNTIAIAAASPEHRPTPDPRCRDSPDFLPPTPRTW